MSYDPKKEMAGQQLLDKSCLNEGEMDVAVPAPSPKLCTVEHWKEFLCGGGSAFCNILISYPLNKLIFRQMMHGVETKNALFQLKNEGLGYLYRGMLPPLMQRTLSMSLMFGVYDECLQPLLKQNVNPYIAKSVAGVIAGCVEATLMPFERVQTLLIHPKFHKKFKNTADAARHIARHYGIKEFYRGLGPILLRNGPSNAMFFIIRDELRQRLPKQEHVLYQSIQHFLAGACIGASLSTLFYPLNVVKIAMQCELGGPHRTVVYGFRYVLGQRDWKFTNFYHGALLNISRAFLSWGIINASYEVFRKLIYC
ncbi:mitochondrial nicotinamide adenine dinucleotide transporter SLC25A51 [Plodia interpunctella]|uniref:mitochondrial nicotinamide adenine dinucleotide transporter SLC25A51 n=1 Tax=Plodia interpunctella TaxID=58824 RepID=UPI0023678D79|nr:mitochondrial nicotinamide adenine dinucleotide transporter SLC25A51 [Plodia interpunctella]XP_053601216.1 mitochondrial nicotinamide adenine dinucleotide transporter SLC25A51 [Plodia interpunctella]